MTKNLICAAAAVLLTALSSTVFVSGDSTHLDRRSGSVSVHELPAA